MNKAPYQKILPWFAAFLLTGCASQNILQPSLIPIGTPSALASQTVNLVTPATTATTVYSTLGGNLLFTTPSGVFTSDYLVQNKISIQSLSEPLASLAMSPTGTRLAYFDRQDQLWIKDLQTGERRRLNTYTLSNPDYTLEWSPDENRLLFSCAAENIPYISICAFDLQTESLQVLLDARDVGVQGVNSIMRFQSQDQSGTKIIFTIAEIPEFGNPSKEVIYLLDTQSQRTSVILDSHTQADISNIIRVALSPDAQTALFDARIGGVSQIFQINIDGTGLRQITSNTLNTMFPFWSPDGEFFYARQNHLSSLDVQFVLYNLNGKVIQTTSLQDTRLWGWYRR